MRQPLKPNKPSRENAGQAPRRRRRRSRSGAARAKSAGSPRALDTPSTTRSKRSGESNGESTLATPGAFRDLGLSQDILRALSQSGYEAPTPIQSQAIQPVLESRDVLGCAQTGTGKTAAFALPILELLSQRRTRQEKPNHKPRALVLAPTRELAAQIHNSFRQYGAFTRLRSTVVFGGVSKQPQTRAINRGVDILVATPGRLLDLMGEGFLSLSNVEVLVLDEADRMLDMGFIHDVKRIVAATPASRQTLLFSATMPQSIESLAAETLDDPVHVAVAPVASTIDTTEQLLYEVEKPSKLRLLYTLLQDPELQRVLVFSRTKHGANKVAKKLNAAGVPTEALHGNKSQGARERALDGFKRGAVRVIVATDLAARGLDVKGLSHVINLDLPNEPETYVHRIGRTGRAGAVGVALSLCAPEERGHLKAIERLIRTSLDRRDLPALLPLPAPKASAATSPAPARRGRGQRRSSDESSPSASTHQGGRNRRSTQKATAQPTGKATGKAARHASRQRRDESEETPNSGRTRDDSRRQRSHGSRTAPSNSPDQAPWWRGARQSRGRSGRPRHTR